MTTIKKQINSLSMKKVVLMLFAANIFAFTATAQVKVTANGNVTMSKDLVVNGKANVKLTNSNDVTLTPINTSTPNNKINMLNPLRFNSLGQAPLSAEETMTTNGLTPVVTPIETMTDHYGFNINEFRQVYPELIAYDNNNNPYINYTELIPILVQAIKQLSNQVNILQQYINNGQVFLMNDDNNEPDMSYAPRNTKIAQNQINNACKLYQNAPNPFSERTMIKFDIPSDKNNAYIAIYDLQGTLKKQINIDAKQGHVTLEAATLTPGMYLYSLIVDNKEMDTKRMIIAK